ncbi:hypothetical protein [Fundicoccus culcitae]|uniref:Endolytic transglycosylase MltG n=1 Tax=Fundicoccus culcitae TaxID=2969821 RepID=A0ABY5P760_9LACT|nr:hypothetical protein [Fundicoccus culcitae]UUX34583.1 endolytic transglycosylase MltG [Fundicoccus culcitae]
MNKNTLRSMGLGFLAAAVLTGAFAIFFQGNVPVQGIQISSILNNNQQYEDELSQYRVEMSSMISERDALESTRDTLNTSIASLNDLNEEQSSTISSLENELSNNESNTADETSTAEEVSADENETSDSTTDTTTDTIETATNTTGDFISGTFTISSGEASTDIANRLESEGYITSATEFQDLVEYWGLESILQANSYQLNSDMSINQIAEILTNGQYYYIP